MSALLELIKETPPEDRRAVAEYLKPYLVPEKKEAEERWVSVEELRPFTPGDKSKEWIKMFILYAYPETRKWSTEPYPGKGRTVKVNLPVAKKWIFNHTDEIDWNQRFPR